LSVIGGGIGYLSHVTFYVGLPDVEVGLREAERFGGKRQMGPNVSWQAWWPGASLTRG